MADIFRIFRKDVRALWLQLALVVAIAASFWWRAFGLLANPDGESAIPFFDIVRALACWYLIASVIHQERLTGDRSYWVTRPFPWPRLLAAKAIFIAAFVNLPLLVFEAASLAAHRVSPWTHAPALLASQFHFTAKVVLPAAAMAAVSATLPEFIGIAIACYVALPLTFNFVFRHAGLFDRAAPGARITALDACLYAIAAVILLLQYRRRRTVFARVLLAGGVALTAFWPLFALPAGVVPRPADRFPIRTVYAPGVLVMYAGRAEPPDLRVPVLTRYRSIMGATVPIDVTGIPEGRELLLNWLNFRMESPERRRSWESGWLSPSPNTIKPHGQFADLRSLRAFARILKSDGVYDFQTEWSAPEQVPDVPLQVTATLDFTVFPLQPDVTPLSAAGGPQPVPGGGFCGIATHGAGYLSAACSWPSTAPGLYDLRVTSRLTGESKSESFSSLSGSTALSIISAPGALWHTLDATVRPPGYPYGIFLEVRQPIASLDRDVRIPLVRINQTK